VFFCQRPSILAHQALMQQVRGINNATTFIFVASWMRWILRTCARCIAKLQVSAAAGRGGALSLLWQHAAGGCGRDRVVYTHAALMAAVVKPGMPQVLALEPEFIESAAARRWIGEVAGGLSSLGVTLLGDDLYACTPIITEVLGKELDYIFVAEESSHQYLYEELASFAQMEGGIEVL